MSKSKKLGSAARFGARYSTPLKKEVAEIEKIQKGKQTCSQCGRKSMKRRGYAKWICTKCGTIMAGGAYEPKTAVGELVQKIVRTTSKEEIKKFEKELEKITKSEEEEESIESAKTEE